MYSAWASAVPLSDRLAGPLPARLSPSTPEVRSVAEPLRCRRAATVGTWGTRSWVAPAAGFSLAHAGGRQPVDDGPGAVLSCVTVTVGAGDWLPHPPPQPTAHKPVAMPVTANSSSGRNTFLRRYNSPHATKDHPEAEQLSLAQCPNSLDRLLVRPALAIPCRPPSGLLRPSVCGRFTVTASGDQLAAEFPQVAEVAEPRGQRSL